MAPYLYATTATHMERPTLMKSHLLLAATHAPEAMDVTQRVPRLSPGLLQCPRTDPRLDSTAKGHGIRHQLIRQERVGVTTRSDQCAEHACMRSHGEHMTVRLASGLIQLVAASCNRHMQDRAQWLCTPY
jgi:hypothetical protein